ncbi:MAG TPA: response regulator transcription factor [Nocardioidaceae bacterium]|nr:response regulator transcription factor [Nocardioidaceae bacterium]
MAQVLIIEDDPTIRPALTRALNAMSHVASTAATAMDGLRQTVDSQPDVVLLDLGLPDLDGASLLAMIRAVSSVPVIVISARDDDRSVVDLLNAGADDYLVKPFTPTQLEARIRAVLRRSQTTPATGPIMVGELSIDIGARQADLAGQTLGLSPKEFDLLAYLADNVGQVISKRTLVAAVWNQPYGGSDKTVDVHLHWLRRKLGESADKPHYLHRVRGVGVKMVDPGP